MQQMNMFRRLFTLSITTLVTAGAILAGNAAAATLTVQTVTNRSNYAPANVVTVRTTAQNGTTRLGSSSIRSAIVTIKNAAGQTIVSGAAMSKDSSTGLCYYSYTLPSSAGKGSWSASVTVTDTSSNSGSGATTFNVKLPVPDHTALISSYEGTKTCIACHAQQATDITNSLHYKWRGDNSKAIELVGKNIGKLGGAINNFCIWPDKNWLTIFNKIDGTKGCGGCGSCHIGYGLKPDDATLTQVQHENNIDCLICHAPVYERDVFQRADGSYYVDAASGVDKLKAARSVTRATRETCLRCHRRSGGNDGIKRGDLDSSLSVCSKNLDVHMGSDGQNFDCQECHRTVSHKMVGRGSDMRALDNAAPLTCENCHAQLPHRSTNTSYSDLNRHTDKVNCTVCHIPSFAKSMPTDMDRNWSTMELDPVKQLFDPVMTKTANVMPTYAWFNGDSHFYRFLDPVALDSRGVQRLSWPDGAFVDATGKTSKLSTFKLHQGSQPMESTSRQLLPVKNKYAFETGDVVGAIQQGAALAGIPYTGHTFVQTEQYMGIYHGVGPKATALSCANGSCHGNENRIPFSTLGYQRRGTTAQLCDVCHSAKTYSSFTSLHGNHRDRKNCAACHGSGYPLKEPVTTLCDNCHGRQTFTSADSVHSRHVVSKGYDCSNCHTFSASMTGGHVEEH